MFKTNIEGLVDMIVISDVFLNSLLKSKGMLSLTQLSTTTGVNRYTLHEILIGSRKVVQKNTYMKLADWLAIIAEKG